MQQMVPKKSIVPLSSFCGLVYSPRRNKEKVPTANISDNFTSILESSLAPRYSINTKVPPNVSNKDTITPTMSSLISDSSRTVIKAEMRINAMACIIVINIS